MYLYFLQAEQWKYTQCNMERELVMSVYI